MPTTSSPRTTVSYTKAGCSETTMKLEGWVMTIVPPDVVKTLKEIQAIGLGWRDPKTIKQILNKNLTSEKEFKEIKNSR